MNGKLTLHVHVWRLVHEMHKELGSVYEDLVSAVADGAVPPCALGARRNKHAGENKLILTLRV